MTQPTSAVPPAVQAPASPVRRSKKEPAQSNVKETLEQILVAFILAFIFRCFIVEAYVIPTGSMAPTLLGAHMNFRCPDCGWHWTVNYSGDNGGEDVPNFASEVYPIRCANCGYKLPRDLPGEADNDATQPPVAYGDRILVQKYIYLLHDPRRWDVVVFKTPDSSGTNAEPYTTNYIKRLIGTPGETIMVLDGDVYTARNKSDLSAYVPGDFTIQTKPYKVQEAMWRVVYNNDYQPRGLARTYLSQGNQYTGNPAPEIVDYPFAQPWKASGAGWDVNGRRFAFNSESTGRISFDANEIPEKHLLSDWLAYDVSHTIGIYFPRGSDIFRDRGYDPRGVGDAQDLENRGFVVQSRSDRRRDDPFNDVSDVKLMFNYARNGGDGPLHVNLTKHRNLFRLELLPGSAELNMFVPASNTPRQIGKVNIPSGAAPIRIEMAVADYRVSVRINGNEVLATTPEQFAPDVAALLKDFEAKISEPKATISIDAFAQTCELSHVSLWRDVYYLTRDSRRTPKWAMPYAFPNGNGRSELMQLGSDEFFVMGDNSMLSSDGRMWTDTVSLPYEGVDVQGGRVPRRFMLGRAFFVYWPAGYSPVNGFIRFVPNFGEMRFIH